MGNETSHFRQFAFHSHEIEFKTVMIYNTGVIEKF